MTNALSAIILSVTWLTNYPPVADGPSRDVWSRTNIVSMATVVAVVGPGIHAVIYTNAPVPVSTNVVLVPPSPTPARFPSTVHRPNAAVPGEAITPAIRKPWPFFTTNFIVITNGKAQFSIP